MIRQQGDGQEKTKQNKTKKTITNNNNKNNNKQTKKTKIKNERENLKLVATNYAEDCELGVKCLWMIFEIWFFNSTNIEIYRHIPQF